MSINKQSVHLHCVSRWNVYILQKMIHGPSNVKFMFELCSVSCVLLIVMLFSTVTVSHSNGDKLLNVMDGVKSALYEGGYLSCTNSESHLLLLSLSILTRLHDTLFLNGSNFSLWPLRVLIFCIFHCKNSGATNTLYRLCGMSGPE